MNTKKVAIFFATKGGQTRTIANYIKDKAIQDMNQKVHLDIYEINKDNFQISIPDDVDCVILGAPVYAQKFPSVFIKWVKKNRESLRGRQTAFFSVSLNAVDRKPAARAADDRLLRKFIDDIGWVPDFVASLGGALKYQSYNWFIRALMKRISAAAGGPTGTHRNYTLTNWKVVDSFVKAILDDDIHSLYFTENRFPQQKMADHFMHEYEQCSEYQVFIKNTPQEVYSTLQALDQKRMVLANLLRMVRTFRKIEPSFKELTFQESAQYFGAITLYAKPPFQLVSGLVGQFWIKNFGIVPLHASHFISFNTPNFSKVVTSFTIENQQPQEGVLVKVDIRIHSTDEFAKRKFKFYWFFLKIVTDLYVRSILNALKKQAEHSTFAKNGLSSMTTKLR